MDGSIGSENHHDFHDSEENNKGQRHEIANNFAKLFSGLKLSNRSSESGSMDKMDEMSLPSNDSNRSRSNSNGSLSLTANSSNGPETNHPKKLKKPRRLLYEARISTDERPKGLDHSVHSPQNNSKLLGEPKPMKSPPKPSVLSPISDAPEREITLTSTHCDTGTAEMNKSDKMNDLKRNAETSEVTPKSLFDNHSIATNTPNLSGADNQYDWGTKSPRG